MKTKMPKMERKSDMERVAAVRRGVSVSRLPLCGVVSRLRYTRGAAKPLGVSVAAVPRGGSVLRYD